MQKITNLTSAAIFSDVIYFGDCADMTDLVCQYIVPLNFLNQIEK